MADQEIKTSIDSLIAYLNEHGETNTGAAAAILGVGEATIIEWANILEKANMIKIVHKSGRMFLSPIQGKAGATSEAGQANQARIEAEIASQVAIVNQIAARIEQFSSTMEAVDKLMTTKYKNVKPLLDRINSIQSRIDQAQRKMETKSKQIEVLSAKIGKEYEVLQKYSSDLSKFSIDTNNARSVSEDIKSKLKAYDANTREMTKALDETIYKYRKNALEMTRVIKERDDELRQIISLEDRQVNDYERIAKSYKQDSDRIIRDIERRRKSVLDEVAKSNDEINRLKAVASKSFTELNSSVDDMKRSLGGMAGLNDSIVAINHDLDSLLERKDALLKELGAMKQEAKVEPGKRSAARKGPNLQTRTQDVSDKINALKSDTERLKTLVEGLVNEKTVSKITETKKEMGGADKIAAPGEKRENLANDAGKKSDVTDSGKGSGANG
ncbi:MAG: hypothetical protein KGH64_01655 [Candidatus Micrarchaeota archaeon]|nr:hypothetical protein [Candidatus Micrarchaeota archaeon]MDE1834022.1 hypothetical protein [Candidatus Micrarchaeota archaeon]MDE1859376.1 hypothetical protein [Candidatus Micrarchaeota archaeon]